MSRVLQGQIVVPGEATGPLLVSSAPLSFWGGYDAATGEIIDRRHPLSGRCAAGHILVLPWTRGSSTTTAILLEAARLKHAPAAIILPKVDSFIALASVVAEEMYGAAFPVIVLDEEQRDELATWRAAHISNRMPSLTTSTALISRLV